jgi:hypothetical protein
MRALFTAAIAVCLMMGSSAAQDGTASLTGQARDILGQGLPGTLAELESTQAPVALFQTVADTGGAYRFSGLPAGEYHLKLSRIGFYSLIIKSVIISNGEHKTMPTFQLAPGASGDCSHDPVELDAIPFLQSADTVGSLGGTVRLGDGLGTSTPMSGAEITLICSTGKACGAAKTDSAGQFLFKALPRGYFSVRFTAEGFYPQDSPLYRVAQGVASAYTSLHVERCHLGNCDPKLRPTKPLVVCE